MYIFIIIFCIVIFCLLLTLLYPININKNIIKKNEQVKGYCPICNHPLYKGEKVQTKQIEIGNIEVQNLIRGCIYCTDKSNKSKRNCPICKKKLDLNETIFATANPNLHPLKLSVKGCKSCYPLF